MPKVHVEDIKVLGSVTLHLFHGEGFRVSRKVWLPARQDKKLSPESTGQAFGEAWHLVGLYHVFN